MGVKAQYNPSTGKVGYNPVTGKVQVVNSAVPPILECFACSRDIGGIEWVTTGITTCCGGSTSPTSNRFEIVGDLAQYLNNTVTLLREETDTDEICTWSHTLDISSAGLTWKRRDNAVDCSGPLLEDERTIDLIEYRYIISAGPPVVQNALMLIFSFGPRFFLNRVGLWGAEIPSVPADCFGEDWPELIFGGDCSVRDGGVTGLFADPVDLSASTITLTEI